MYLAISACKVPGRGLVGVGQQCLGIDVASGPPAPGGKVGTAHFGLDGPDTLVMQALQVLLRSGFPFPEAGVPAAVGQE